MKLNECNRHKMIKVKESNANNNNGEDVQVIELFKLRNGSNMLEPKLPDDSTELIKFNQLPKIEFWQQLGAKRKLQENSLQLAFPEVVAQLIWDTTSFVDSIETYQQSAEKHPQIVINILFGILAYIFTIEKPDETDFFLLIQGLDVILPSKFPNLSSYFFKKMLLMFLPLKMGQEAAIKIFNHFKKNASLNSSLSTAYVACVFGFGLPDTQTIFEIILNTTILLVEQQRDSLSKNDYLGLVRYFDPSFKALNVKTIHLFSLYSKHVDMRSFFSMIATMVCEKYRQENGLSIDENENDKSTETLFNDPSTLDLEDYTIYDDEPIENGFTIPSFDLVKSADLIKPKFSWLSNALSDSEDLCIDSFFTSFQKSMLQLISDAHFYDIFNEFVFLISELSDRCSLIDFMPILSNERVFSPAQNVFTSTISKVLNAIRKKVFKLLISRAQSLLSDFIESSVGYPCLFSEHLLRILSQTYETVDLQNFTAQQTSTAIILGLKNIQFLRHSNKSKELQMAYHTAFSFVFHLLSNQRVAVECFWSPTFVRCFMSFVFESNITTMIVSAIRDIVMALHFEKAGNTISSYICELLSYCMNQQNDRYDEIAQKIIDFLIQALAHNQKIISVFYLAMDAMFKYAQSRPSEKVLQLCLKFLSLLSINDSHFSLSSRGFRMIVDIIKSQKTSESVFLSLQNLIAGALALGTDSLFLIKRPSNIPIVFAAYGESDKIIELTQHFQRLCSFSESNAIACHDGGLDFILLTFIEAFYTKNTNEIMFRGVSFKLNFSEQDIKDLLFPLIGLIITIKSNNVIIQKFVDLMMAIDHPEICVQTANFLNILQASQTNQCYVPLGKCDPVISFTGIKSRIFNKSFSFCFWLKIDLPICLESQVSSNIITLKDSENEMSLFINRGGLFYINGSYSCQCLASIPSNKWIYMSFVCQRYTEDKTALGLYYESQMAFCQEVPKLYFADQEIDVFIGGANEKISTELRVGQVGSFGFNVNLLDDSILDNIDKSGAKAFDEHDGFIINSNNITQSNQTYQFDNCEITVTNSTESLNSFDKCLIHSSIGIALSDLFEKLDQLPNGYVEIIIGLMKHVFSLISEPFTRFPFIRASLMSQKQLGYHLYLAFFSLTDVLKDDESLFDNLILNPDLWIKSPSFSRIVHHWGNIVINICRNMFERPRFFSKILKMFRDTFEIDNCSDQKALNNFIHLIEESGRVSLGQLDINFIFNITYDADDEFAVIYLGIIRNLAPEIKSFQDITHPLTYFVESENRDIVLSAIAAIHDLSAPEVQKPLTSIALQIRHRPDIEQLFSMMIEQLDNFNGLFHTISASAISLPEQRQKEAIIALERMNINVEWLSSEKYWFIWPLLLSISCHSLNNFFKKIPYDQEIVVDTIMMLEAITNQDLSMHAFNSFPSLSVNSLLRLGMFKFNDFLISPVIMKTFEDSPFYTPFETSPLTQIRSILTFEQLLNQDFSQCDIRVSLWLNPNDEKTFINQGILNKLKKEINQAKDYILLTDFLKTNKIQNNEFHVDQHKISKLYRKRIHSTAVDLRHFIKEVKSLVCVDIEVLKQLLDNVVDVSCHLPVHNEHESALEVQRIRDGTYCFGFAPSRLKYIVAVPELEEILFKERKVTRHKSSIINPTFKNTLGKQLNRSPSPPTSPRNSSPKKDQHSAELIIEPELKKAVRYQKQISYPKLPNNSSFLLVAPALWYNMGKPKPISFHLTKRMIYLVQKRETVYSFAASQIWFILPRIDTAMEIFLYNRTSLYLDFSPLENHKVLSTFDKVKDSISNIPSYIHLMEKNRMTSQFEQIMFRTYFEGNSFHHFNNLPTIKNRPAEDFFLAEESSIQKVYNNRIILENIDKNIEEFKEEPSKSNIGLDFIKFGGFFTRNCFIAFDEKLENVYFYKIEDGYATLTKQHEISEISSSSLVALHKNGVVVYDKKFHIITEDKYDVNTNFEGDVEMMMTMGDYIIFVSDKCSVYKANIDSKLQEIIKIELGHETISSIGVNNNCHSIAYGTQTCNLHIITQDGETISIVPLVSNEPAHVIVTSCFGFVVVDAEDRIYVFTNNGTLVKSSHKDFKITKMKAYRTLSGFDFILFDNQKNNIGYFEAAHPDSMHIIFALDSKVIDFTYKGKCIEVLTQDGFLHHIPFDFPAPKPL